MLWSMLKQELHDEPELFRQGTTYLILYFDGEVSLLTTSILRGHGCEAYSVLGRFPALRHELQSSRTRPEGRKNAS